MFRYSTFIDESQWVEVSLSEPCVVCGAISECTVLESREFARCSRTVSEWPVLDGGWLHRLDGVVRTRMDALTPA